MLEELIEPPKGCYRQKDEKKLVLKAHLSGGRMSVAQLQTLCQVLRDYPKASVRFTVRQNARFYDLEHEEVEQVRALLLSKGFSISTLGTAVVMNEDSGFRKDECFDVYPYLQVVDAWQASELSLASQVPGKLKISLCSHDDDFGNTSYADVGFYATLQDGKHAFKVYGGGSLGAQPRLGMYLETIPAEDVIDVLNAMSLVFIDLFKDSTIGKKRLRFKIKTLGENHFIELYRQKRTSLMSQHDGFELPQIKEVTSVKEQADINHALIKATKIDGCYTVRLPLLHKAVFLQQLALLEDFLASLDYEPILQLTSRQELAVLNLHRQDAALLVEKIEAYFGEDMSVSIARPYVACIGRESCKFGLSDTSELVGVLRKASVSSLPSINISGCMNSCARQQITPLGFWGKGKLDTDEDIFEVTLGGRVRNKENEARLSENIGSLKISKIGLFLELLAENKEKSNLSWEIYIENNVDTIKALREKVDQS